MTKDGVWKVVSRNNHNADCDSVTLLIASMQDQRKTRANNIEDAPLMLVV